MADPQTIVGSWLAAIEARDVDAMLTYFSPDAIWQNVPHPAAIGHSAIRSMLAPILARSELVRWEIVTESYGSNRAWLERVDRFTIDGTEYAVQCNGVLDIDTDQGVITALRDYVDITEWRSRIAAAEI